MRNEFPVETCPFLHTQKKFYEAEIRIQKCMMMTHKKICAVSNMKSYGLKN